MKTIQNLTLDQLKLRFRQLENKWEWHLSRRHSKEGSEDRMREIQKELDEILNLLKSKVEINEFINKHK